MKKPFQVRCRDAVYDPSDQMIVFHCFFEEFGESRIIHFARADFHYKFPGNLPPHSEMHKTAQLFKGKRFKIVIEDDPNRNKDAELSPDDMAKDFRDLIVDKMEEVSEGLTDSKRLMARRLGDVIEKDMAKRKSMGDVLADEMLIRAKLKDIKF